MTVTFVLTDRKPLAELAALDPDRDWREFVTGERAWILQTFLRLRAAGLDVDLQPSVPDSGLVVFSAKQRRQLRAPARASRAILVAVREDVGRARFADFEIVQNPAQADGTRRFHIPLWPQPGLVPRDARRGARVECVAFKGFAQNLHQQFRTREWHAWLAARGLRWTEDTTAYAGDRTRTADLSWHDYADVDVIVAVRPAHRRLHPRKPATKLVNAWLAGVPAILGPESAYRAMRTSALDYLEAASLEGVCDALECLRRDAGCYAAMVAHGRQRAPAFGARAVTDVWLEQLERVRRAPVARRIRRTEPWWRRWSAT